MKPKQITFDENNHELDNNDNFSPDDRFLCYDTRPGEGSIQGCLTIEKVEVASGKTTTLCRAQEPDPKLGPGLAAASYHPTEDRVIFIHGPQTATGFQYDQAHRFGVSVPGSGSGETQYVDARDVTAPYTAGALRGGTHRHEYDGSGRYVGFTYNDTLMKKRGVDLRTIGVTRLGTPVQVDSDPRNTNGTGFSTLVVQVVAGPKPGSDEISRAAGDSWVGLNGYLAADGRRQLARGFIGMTRTANGASIDEVYVVDIPDENSRPGPDDPLEGTDSTFPAPPLGASQRRLTHTESLKKPGCKGIVRSSPDGAWLSFLAYAEGGTHAGTQQIFVVSPLGGPMRRLSDIPGGVGAEARWHPSGQAVVTTDTAGRLLTVSTADGDSFGHHAVLLDDDGPAPFALVVSRKGSKLAFNRSIATAAGSFTQILVLPYEVGPNGLPAK